MRTGLERDKIGREITEGFGYSPSHLFVCEPSQSSNTLGIWRVCFAKRPFLMNEPFVGSSLFGIVRKV